VSPSGEKEKKKVCSTRFLFCSSRF
jgi:hypothetical protein